MKRKSFLFVLFLFVFPCVIAAQEEVPSETPVFTEVEEKVLQTSSDSESQEVLLLEEPSDTKWLCDLFMLKLINEGVQAAFQELMPYFSIPADEISVIQLQTIQQLEMIKPRYGEQLGYTLLKEENVENVVLKFTYLQKFEKHAIRSS